MSTTHNKDNNNCQTSRAAAAATDALATPTYSTVSSRLMQNKHYSNLLKGGNVFHFFTSWQQQFAKIIACHGYGFDLQIFPFWGPEGQGPGHSTHCFIGPHE